MNNNYTIRVINVSKTFKVASEKITTLKSLIFKIFAKRSYRTIQALSNLEFNVTKGEIFGIIGRNGSGKSTLLKIILGAIPPNKGGEVLLNGKIIRLSLGIGFDQTLTARENIYLNGSILGLSMKQIGLKFKSIIEFAELEKFTDTKIKYYSTGMRSRLAFSIALNAEADIFLLDEFFGGVGDLIFKKKSAEVFNSTILKGRTIVLVSHQLADISKYCDRVLYLKEGQMAFLGDPKQAIEMYKAENNTRQKTNKKN